MSSVLATLSYPVTTFPSEQRVPKVLVVDSDRHSVDYVRFLLEEAGYSTSHASPGAEAILEARRTKPKVVIAEVFTPEIDGFSLCRRLKNSTDSSGVAVILVSPLSVEERAREAGADAFLRKPVSERALLRAVQRLLSSRFPARGAISTDERECNV